MCFVFSFLSQRNRMRVLTRPTPNSELSKAILNLVLKCALLGRSFPYLVFNNELLEGLSLPKPHGELLNAFLLYLCLNYDMLEGLVPTLASTINCPKVFPLPKPRIKLPKSFYELFKAYASKVNCLGTFMLFFVIFSLVILNEVPFTLKNNHFVLYFNSYIIMLLFINL
ncbi:hypothetical protein HPP92_008583 [Vanilla planifolia]|uniref:Uncharacterized protein n=1 Tax=Vanilla planifolia TaxID=51239 RepID=A0A835R4Z8_VANPL|nr:hypothetical protein HPP92_008583 [Vanilla planifolia]